jgi:hypothetical protein
MQGSTVLSVGGENLEPEVNDIENKEIVIENPY